MPEELSAKTYQCFLDRDKSLDKTMNPSQSHLFISLITMTEEQIDGVLKKVESESVVPGYSIMKNRIQLSGGHVIEESVLIFLALSCVRTPGDAVMWAYTLTKMVEKGGDLSMDDFVAEFPMGFPGESETLRIWEAQKELGAPSGNWLDYGNWLA